jgi:hypothetical protein
MSSGPESSTQNRQEQIAEAWRKLDSLLPVDYLKTTVDGRVLADFHTPAVHIRQPKLDFWGRLPGFPVEKVVIGSRQREVGLPTNDAYEWARQGIQVPLRGVIHDDLYTPIRPREGSALPLRHTRFGFKTTTDVDHAGHIRQDGLHFSLLERLDREAPDGAVLVVSYHNTPNGDISHESVRQFLTVHGFSSLNDIGSREEAPALLEFCTDQALHAQQ